MTQEFENNTVTLWGKVVSECEFSHEVYGEGFYKFYLESPRLSDITDIIPITISERLIDENVLKIGNFISITGQLRSYNDFSGVKNKLILTVFTKDVKMEESNQNPNKIVLNGFICKKPVYRTTPFGREIADILLAVNRSYNKSDYIPCISWGRNARFSNKLNVGDNVKITGRVQSREYQKTLETGEVLTKTAYEVSISNLEIITAG